MKYGYIFFDARFIENLYLPAIRSPYGFIKAFNLERTKLKEGYNDLNQNGNVETILKNEEGLKSKSPPSHDHTPPAVAPPIPTPEGTIVADASAEQHQDKRPPPPAIQSLDRNDQSQPKPYIVTDFEHDDAVDEPDAMEDFNDVQEKDFAYKKIIEQIQKKRRLNTHVKMQKRTNTGRNNRIEKHFSKREPVVFEYPARVKLRRKIKRSFSYTNAKSVERK